MEGKSKGFEISFVFSREKTVIIWCQQWTLWTKTNNINQKKVTKTLLIFIDSDIYETKIALQINFR